MQKILRRFIREEVWRTVARSAGFHTAGNIGALPRTGKPMFGKNTLDDEERFEMPPAEYEDDEVIDTIDGEDYVVQGVPDRLKLRR